MKGWKTMKYTILLLSIAASLLILERIVLGRLGKRVRDRAFSDSKIPPKKPHGEKSKGNRPAQGLEVDDWGVKRFLPGGEIESVAWGKLIGVDINTTSDGPFAEDVFFILIGENDTGCVVPQSIADQLVPRLLKLPNIHHERMIAAMGSTEDRTFVCWRKSDQGCPPADE
jgi:hypothetical protein